MRSAAVLILSLATSAFAYSVTQPSATKGWTNSGAQTVSWSMVSTDASNFTIVLTNTDRSVLPENNQILKALVDGASGTTTVSPPSSGWPVGGTFVVNLVKDSESLNTIYAQSNQFNITAAASSSGTSSGTSSGALATTGTGTTAAGATGTGTTISADSTSTASDDASTPSASSNAALPISVNSGLIGVVAFLGAFLA